MNKLHWRKYVLNKWTLAALSFILILLFNDRYSLFDRFRYVQKLHKVRNENEYLQSEITRVHKEQEELFSNQKNIEKFAREKYYMKRDDEDVFVVIDSTSSK